MSKAHTVDGLTEEADGENESPRPNLWHRSHVAKTWNLRPPYSIAGHSQCFSRRFFALPASFTDLARTVHLVPFVRTSATHLNEDDAMIATMKAKTKNTDPATSLEWDGTARAGQRGCTPRGPLTALRRLELSEEIGRALHISSDRAQCQIRWFHLVLAGLVSMTLVLAAVVWWRLLT